MKTTNETGLESTSLTLLKRAIEVCDRYEAEWRAGCPSPLEHYLGTALAQDRPAILHRLLCLEVELRRARGEQPTEEEYLRRFPEEALLIASAFRELDSAPALLAGAVIHFEPRLQASRVRLAHAATPSDGHRVDRCLECAPEPLNSSTPVSDQTSSRSLPSTLQTSDRSQSSSGAGQFATAGRYTLIRLVGEGGIGQVWLARDQHMDREIALKRLQPMNSLSPAAQARFLREARVTGQLQHPGVAPVYELVQSPEQPELFYTMRFINGRTLTQAARDYHRRQTAGEAQPLDLRELIGAFLSVCQVIAYAHSRGVIHRDIKGQNVVLGDFGEVMVLDWGLAKVVGEPDETAGEDRQAGCPRPIVDAAVDPCDETAQGEILGTPSHMSPEQATGHHDLVGPRSDIYGLGAILYQILTGESPFRGDKYEVLRKVIEELPEPPRHRIAGLSLALDAICLKCLAKAPGDRYSSAADLARDVQRYLADEPVTAFKEPSSMKVKRWIGRHRTLAIASTATLLVATLILSGWTVSLKRANQREASAHAIAEDRLTLAMTAVDDFVTDFGEDPLLKAHGLERPRRRLLMRAKDFYEIFAREKGREPRVEVERGNSYLRLAKLTENLGEASEATALSQQARSIFTDLHRLYPVITEYREGVARALLALGSNYGETKQPEAARAVLEEAATVWEGLARDHPETHRYRGQMVTALNRLGRVLCLALRDYTGCEEVLERSLALGASLTREYPAVPEYRNEHAEAMLLTGIAKSYRGEFQLAKGTLEKSLSLRESIVAEYPEVMEYQSDLVDSCALIASSYLNAGEPDRVPELYTKVWKISDRLARVHPDVPIFAEKRCLIEIVNLIHIARVGDHARATAEAEQSVAQAKGSGLALLFAACCFSVASDAARRDPGLADTDRRERTERYQARAMAFVREAQATGLLRQPFYFEAVRSDEQDLAALRARADFPALVAALEADRAVPPR